MIPFVVHSYVAPQMFLHAGCDLCAPLCFVIPQPQSTTGCLPEISARPSAFISCAAWLPLRPHTAAQCQRLHTSVFALPAVPLHSNSPSRASNTLITVGAFNSITKTHNFSSALLCAGLYGRRIGSAALARRRLSFVWRRQGLTDVGCFHCYEAIKKLLHYLLSIRELFKYS